jgi:hypothetical protein
VAKERTPPAAPTIRTVLSSSGARASTIRGGQVDRLGSAPVLGDDCGTHRMTIVRAVGSARILEILSLDPDDVLAGCSRTVATGGVD